MQVLQSRAYDDRAFRAYFRAANLAGDNRVDQPASITGNYLDPTTGRRYIVLTGGRRPSNILAVFRVEPDDHLKRLRRWPAVLTELDA